MDTNANVSFVTILQFNINIKKLDFYTKYGIIIDKYCNSGWCRKMQIQVNNFSIDDRVKAVFKNRRLNVKLHIHQFAELVYVMEGKILVKHNAISEIANMGDIIVVPPFQEHSFYTEGTEKAKYWTFMFSDTFIQDILYHENGYLEFQKMVLTPSNELRAFLESKMFETGSNIIIEPDFKNKLLVKSMIYAVFSEHLKNVHHASKKIETTTEQKNASYLVESVIKYMRANFLRDVSIEDCSKETGYSVSHISHSLPKHLHMTFLQLRNSLRINYARNLLRFSRINTKMVGFECGFNCEKTFERVFKQLTGMTPKQFRNNT